MRLFRIREAELQCAFFRVYNDWFAEFCRHAPRRLHGLGLISLWDVDAGVAELERCAALGMKGAMIWGGAPADAPYHSPAYDRLWTAAQDLGLPLSLHIVSGMGEESRVDFTAPAIRYMHMLHEVQRSLSQLVLGGVLERFPRLCIVGAESDVGWLAHWIQRMDHAHARFGAMMDVPLALRPSEYVRRQVRLTFLDDPVGAASLESLGADTFMWGSDFPHTDSTWPNSRAVIEKNLAGVPHEIASRVLCKNAAELYRVEL
jgi:predicted TIM-barrel fold metal-dependent hydrolase